MKKFSKNKVIQCLILLIFVLLLHISLGYTLRFFYVLTFTAFLLCLSGRFKKTYSISIILLSIIGAIYTPIGLKYGSPNINSVISFFYTNTNETLEFVQTLSPINIIYSLLVIIFGLLSLKVSIFIKNKLSILIILIFITTSITWPIRNFVNNGSYNIEVKLPILRFFNDIKKHYDSVKIENEWINAKLNEKDTWQLTNNNTQYNNYILVIGESVRRDFMQSYGFPINNTPFLEKKPVIQFNNYISSAPSTLLSLPQSLTLENQNTHELELPNNIITLAKKAGLNTFWFSNQGSMVGSDSIISTIGKRADSYHFLSKGDYHNNGLTTDNDLLPDIKKALFNSNKKTNLIVVHLIGSHSQACARTQGKYDEFFQSTELSCYVQSIKNTDKLLENIVTMSNNTGKSWSLLYFADHGLAYEHKGESYAKLAHDDKFKQNFEIPLFILSSDSKEKNYITERRNNRYFMSLFSEWTGITDAKIPNHCHMISNDICDDQDTVINFQKEEINYNLLPEDKIDYSLRKK
ncbi:phosphoethanolamine transferase [Proteus terrae]|uniref:phosphoethanolamine transferase n=1 Tax=Proteus terrae TaxID=1574161 RepID=UPI001330B940|nr:phosphoethanolamine transferase [Proteus terrae]QKD71047.1 phosphoethanolamine transferase [Proteus terrae subsp. cibarius]QKD72874.1 phosphoethanolamine transferase [Proteus terrae subsp. cibarius]UDF26041.1 phosphoethanolamine transferase [Proteus terrae subsp. cibarius]WCG86970.1 phosphoethanolamine transferase [Proteus terrae]